MHHCQAGYRQVLLHRMVVGVHGVFGRLMLLVEVILVRLKQQPYIHTIISIVKAVEEVLGTRIMEVHVHIVIPQVM